MRSVEGKARRVLRTSLHMELNCHRALTALTEGQGSLKAHPGRKQTGGTMLPSLLDSVRHPAPFREVAHDPLILSCHLHPLRSFVYCSRATRVYLSPMPEGTAYEPGKIVYQKPPKKPGSGGPGSDERGSPSFQAHGTGACAGAGCGIPLAGYAGPGDFGHLSTHAPDSIASSLWRTFRMLWPFSLSVRSPEHEPPFAAYLFLICLKASCPSRNSRVFLWKR